MKIACRKFIILVLFLSLMFLAWNKFYSIEENVSEYTIKEVKIKGNIIKVEVADTREKREKGLSGRQSLPENQGMLFVFDTFGYYSFWMKDMNFSLDFIWISGNEIKEITRNVRPEDYQSPKTLSSKNKIDKVIEVNAGLAEKLGIKEGDKLEF